ncbi:Pkinase-domain-containing protein [Neolentinus lepideus HHB14362 ss-1]|uniref:Pkinase-domain-containing protein n=1 Tax=Neolentinus lepideus HHB14362 ss-1 TaxID=1314782 RepID=A0A165UX50_9AGAM|nr:Pkinase-domain-containing protein [Neolentinus lepideus HHB14362 ss-1]
MSSENLGKSMPTAANALNPDGGSPKATMPTQGNPGSSRIAGGTLTISVSGAQGLSLPSGTLIPPAVQAAQVSQQAKATECVSLSSVREERLRERETKKRDSVERMQCWWLPYLILEFEVNQIIITPLGGVMENPVYMYQAHFDVSHDSEISLQCYLRTDEPKQGGDGIAGNDILMGGGQSLTTSDFELITAIAQGSGGRVIQMQKRDTQRIYALKSIRKAYIVDPKEIAHTLAERSVLARVRCPFIVPLKFSFQSEQRLYLVMAFVNGGELFRHLQQEGPFSGERSRFYAAELLLALEHLHELDVVYHDLKPENILLDYTGHIALCDFGLCKLNMKDSGATNTFCGMPEYLAPEVLNGQGYNKTVDWWTLGVLLYEMLVGLPPFYDESTDITYQKILESPLTFPDHISPLSKSILIGLLTRDPTKRLGVNGAEEIKGHDFFKKYINFDLLWQKKVVPPFKPSVANPVDVSSFDTVFTEEAPLDSVVEGSHLSQTVHDQFTEVSYDRSNMPVSPV